MTKSENMNFNNASNIRWYSWKASRTKFLSLRATWLASVWIYLLKHFRNELRLVTIVILPWVDPAWWGGPCLVGCTVPGGVDPAWWGAPCLVGCTLPGGMHPAWWGGEVGQVCADGACHCLPWKTCSRQTSEQVTYNGMEHIWTKRVAAWFVE